MKLRKLNLEWQIFLFNNLNSGNLLTHFGNKFCSIDTENKRESTIFWNNLLIKPSIWWKRNLKCPFKPFFKMLFTIDPNSKAKKKKLILKKEFTIFLWPWMNLNFLEKFPLWTKKERSWKKIEDISSTK